MGKYGEKPFLRYQIPCSKWFVYGSSRSAQFVVLWIQINTVSSSPYSTWIANGVSIYSVGVQLKIIIMCAWLSRRHQTQFVYFWEYPFNRTALSCTCSCKYKRAHTILITHSYVWMSITHDHLFYRSWSRTFICHVVKLVWWLEYIIRGGYKALKY